MELRNSGKQSDTRTIRKKPTVQKATIKQNLIVQSDTPRTDAATELYGDRPFMTPAVPVEFSEELERELAEANRLLKNVKESAVVLTEAGMEYLEKAKKAEAELAELWSRFDKQMQAEEEAQNLKAICDEQQATLKFWGEEIEELRFELIAARESEAVWKTERDKADQRRLEAEAELDAIQATISPTDK